MRINKIWFRIFVLSMCISCVDDDLVFGSTQLEICEEGRSLFQMRELQNGRKVQGDVGDHHMRNQEESQVDVNVNLVFLTIKAKIKKEEILPILGVGSVCFVSGYVILHYCGIV